MDEVYGPAGGEQRHGQPPLGEGDGQAKEDEAEPLLPEHFKLQFSGTKGDRYWLDTTHKIIDIVDQGHWKLEDL